MSTFQRGSYLTLAEYKAAPTALDVTSLVPGGSSEDQDNELAGIIARASRWLDNVARQPLYATQTINQREETRVDRQGNIVLHGRQDRVVSVDALAWGYLVTQLNTISTPITAWIEEDRALVPFLGQSGTVFSGNLGFLAPPGITCPIHVQWSYTAGWATTVLAADAASGDDTVTVADPTGIAPLQFPWLTLVNGADSAAVQAASVDGNTVTLTAPLTDAWPSGSGLTGAPADLREGCVLATSHYIKMRAAGGWAMTRVPDVEVNTERDLSPELSQAQQIALRYQRVTP